MKNIIAVVVIISALSSCAQSPFKVQDGKWWLTINREQRVGYLSGFADCSIYDVGEKRLGHFSAINEELKISRHYIKHPEDQHKEVEEVIWKICLGSKLMTPAPKGEIYKNKHGFFDGDYWRQAGPDHRLGFIQGYLYCQKKYGKPLGGFKDSAESYVSQVSKWYGLKSPDSDEIDESKIDKKIADVLLLFSKK